MAYSFLLLSAFKELAKDKSIAGLVCIDCPGKKQSPFDLNSRECCSRCWCQLGDDFVCHLKVKIKEGVSVHCAMPLCILVSHT